MMLLFQRGLQWGKIMPLIIALFCLLPSPVAHAAEPAPLKLDIRVAKQILKKRDGIPLLLTLTAQKRTKLCLEDDPLRQIQAEIFRQGQGKLSFKPLVLQDNNLFFKTPLRVVWLEPGKTFLIRANLKRFEPDNGDRWASGAYSVKATFNLCEQTPDETVQDTGVEIPIPAIRPAWFMIEL